MKSIRKDRHMCTFFFCIFRSIGFGLQRTRVQFVRQVIDRVVHIFRRLFTTCWRVIVCRTEFLHQQKRSGVNAYLKKLNIRYVLYLLKWSRIKHVVFFEFFLEIGFELCQSFITSQINEIFQEWPVFFPRYVTFFSKISKTQWIIKVTLYNYVKIAIGYNLASLQII